MSHIIPELITYGEEDWLDMVDLVDRWCECFSDFFFCLVVLLMRGIEAKQMGRPARINHILFYIHLAAVQMLGWELVSDIPLTAVEHIQSATVQSVDTGQTPYFADCHIWFYWR